jgi:hypothetical protein
MIPPPTLNYAPPPPPPRGLTGVFAFLLLIGILYVGIILLFGVSVALGSNYFLSDLLTISIMAAFAGIFITAAIRIRRNCHRWALIAFLTTVINIWVLLLGFGFIAVFARESNANIPCPILFFPLIFLIALARRLFLLMRDLQESA